MVKKTKTNPENISIIFPRGIEMTPQEILSLIEFWGSKKLAGYLICKLEGNEFEFHRFTNNIDFDLLQPLPSSGRATVVCSLPIEISKEVAVEVFDAMMQKEAEYEPVASKTLIDIWDRQPVDVLKMYKNKHQNLLLGVSGKGKDYVITLGRESWDTITSDMEMYTLANKFKQNFRNGMQKIIAKIREKSLINYLDVSDRLVEVVSTGGKKLIKFRVS